MPAEDAAAAVAALDALTRKLRVECPWDAEQDARSIVPHTVEEAYELADAANSGDDAKLLDELGDVLFQVHFLSLLLEERGRGSLAEVAEHVRQKLIHRHPHVFPRAAPELSGGSGAAEPAGTRGDVEVASAGEVLANWDEIKKGEAGREPGIFGEVPENLPGPLYARKVQRRAKTAGLDRAEVPYSAITGAVEALRAAEDPQAQFARVGDALFAAVDVARKLKVDPELALRASADRFRARVQAAEALCTRSGAEWDTLTPEQREQFYAEAEARSPAA